MLSPTDVDLYALFGMDLDRTSPIGTNVSCLHLLGSFRFQLRITSQVSAPNDERRAEDRKDVSTGNCSRSGNAFNPNSKVCDRKLIGALSLPLIRPHCGSVDGRPMGIKGEQQAILIALDHSIALSYPQNRTARRV